MKNSIYLKLPLTVLFLFLLSSLAISQAVGEAEVVNPNPNTDFQPKLSVGGDFDTGRFLVEYRLPEDTKKHTFKILNPEGKVIVKEKFGKEKAGYHKFFYNIRYEPKGVYTFIISTKEGYLIKRKFEKKGKA